MPDFGLVAEAVAEVEPLLTFTNERGEIEGVKYDRLNNACPIERNCMAQDSVAIIVTPESIAACFFYYANKLKRNSPARYDAVPDE